MKPCRPLTGNALRVLGVSVLTVLLLGAAPAASGQDAAGAGMQVLTRGPVHEAFAEASMSGALAGVVIAKSPYDPIRELPPDQRPAGDNVAWIPGYWGWDDDRTDFIWVSGVWRDIPPGRQWVPGYWAPVNGGSQWISGFWGDAAQTEVTYLPAPPEPLEAGPSSPMPAPGNLWTPGSWVWQRSRYDWQPGYWVAQQPDWVWSPAHYTWTPRGYVYVPGYWDYAISRRGMMFAPVYYDRPVYRRPDYFYSPTVVIDLGAVVASLFIQQRSRHYYFGDYYDRRYEERGFFPWHERRGSRHGDDFLYAQYRSSRLLQSPDWDRQVNDEFRRRRDHVDARPPQTFALQVNVINTQSAGTRENRFIGRSLADVAGDRAAPGRFRPVNMDERRQIETRGREVHKLQSTRAEMEAAPVVSEKPRAGRATAKPVSMRLPQSPVSAGRMESRGGAKVPPPPPVLPQPPEARGGDRPEKPRRAAAPQGSPSAPPPRINRTKPVFRDHSDRTTVTPSPMRAKPQRVESAPGGKKPEAATRKQPAKPETKTPEAGTPRPERKTPSVRPEDTKRNGVRAPAPGTKSDRRNKNRGK